MLFNVAMPAKYFDWEPEREVRVASSYKTSCSYLCLRLLGFSSEFLKLQVSPKGLQFRFKFGLKVSPLSLNMNKNQLKGQICPKKPVEI